MTHQRVTAGRVFLVAVFITAFTFLTLGRSIQAVDTRTLLQFQKFIPSDLDFDDYGNSGAALAVSADGNRLLVGAPNASSNNSDEDFCGAVYFYVRAGGSWLEQQKLTLLDCAGNAGFGYALAMNGAGTQALISSHLNNGDRKGAVHAFAFDGTSWNWQQTLTPSNTSDYVFGVDIGMSADGLHALIGSPSYADQFASTGAVYYFVFNGIQWVEQQRILTSGILPRECLGSEVAINANGDVALVLSVPGFCGRFNDESKHYIFTRSGNVWSEHQLIPNIGVETLGGGLGLSVNGRTAFFGSWRDGVQVYTRHPLRVNWEFRQLLTASDILQDSFKGFGASAIDVNPQTDTVIIGAGGADSPAGGFTGAAYVFKYDGVSWSERAKLYAGDGAFDAAFGVRSVIVPDNSAVVIGAPGDGQNFRGAVYSFLEDGNGLPPTLTPSATLTPTETATSTPTPAGTDEVTPPTETPTGDQGNLVENGGFEPTNGRDVSNLSPWILKKGSKDDIKCNVPNQPSIAYRGNCAFRFKGVPGEDARLFQTIDTSGMVFAAGSGVHVSAWVNGASIVTNGRMSLRVAYTDGTPIGKVNLWFVPTNQYIQFKTTYTFVTPNVKAIKLQFNHTSPSGKVFIDQVSLEIVEDAVSIQTDLIPLPK